MGRGAGASGTLDGVRVDDRALRRLLEAAGEGDDRALGALVRATQPDVWRVCSALGSPGQTEDLVQETYLRAMRSLGTYRGASAVTVWLSAIARNVCADDVRRRQRRRRLVDRLSQAARLDEHVMEVEPIGDLLDALDADRREAFVLTQLVGLSYEEAAEVVGCPVGTIRSRVSRARADLVAVVARTRAV